MLEEDYHSDRFKTGKKGVSREIREDLAVLPEIKKRGHMRQMRLNLILPEVDPEKITTIEKCVDKKCSGTHFKIRQSVKKAVRDSKYAQVNALRYECMKCRRTIQVYPQGV
jgi:hypothetical protein